MSSRLGGSCLEPDPLPPGIRPPPREGRSPRRLVFKNLVFKTHYTLYSDFYSKNKLCKSGIMSEKKSRNEQNNERKACSKKLQNSNKWD